ncbi:glycosyltransferase [Vicingaceae bacterium]|nr:glycosyltransferase [Vicingaceae bacterium]
MKKILILSHSEICYNARLLKAADFFYSQGWAVTVFNPVIGLARKDTYDEVVDNRPWKVLENDISKRTYKSKFKWFVVSVLHKLVVLSVERLNWVIFQDYYLNKGLILAPQFDQDVDVVLVHLIDNLPFATRFKKKYGAQIIYDSQEYFVGQYDAFDPKHSKWVKENEKRCMDEVTILLTTTEVMRQQLLADYTFLGPSFRVRNIPTRAQSNLMYPDSNSETGPLKLVWHGMGIFLNNRRGLHILLQAVALCKENVVLYFQGNITQEQNKLLDGYIQKYSMGNKVLVKPPANPDQIIDSLKGFDVGLTGELPEEDNQRLTSSNKLFDYLHAGLAVISADTPGLAETVDEYSVGLLYQPGNVEELSHKIDELAADKIKLTAFKEHSKLAAKELFWETDYKDVIQDL